MGKYGYKYTYTNSDLFLLLDEFAPNLKIAVFKNVGFYNCT